MTVPHMSNTIRHLYTQGMRDYEIVERTGFSLILVKHEIAKLIHNNVSAESKHYINRHKKGRYVRAYFVNDDPHWEKESRFVYCQ